MFLEDSVLSPMTALPVLPLQGFRSDQAMLRARITGLLNKDPRPVVLWTALQQLREAHPHLEFTEEIPNTLVKCL